MEVSSLLSLGAKGLRGSSGAGWLCGLQEPDASLLMTWKPPAPFLHSWKGVLLTCLPTVRTRTRKRKGTGIKASVLKTETGLCESIDSGLGHTRLCLAVGWAVRVQWSFGNSRFKSSFRCATTSEDLSLVSTLGCCLVERVFVSRWSNIPPF